MDADVATTTSISLLIISSISITDLESFDVATPVNSDVTPKFRYYDKRDYLEIKELLNNSYQDLFYPGYYSGSDSTPTAQLQSSVILMLMEPPTTSGSHRFKVSILLKSGLRIEQTTSTITLQ